MLQYFSMNNNEYFQYILSDEYLYKNDYKLNESFETDLYKDEFNKFASIPLSDMLPMMYIMENNNFTEQDLDLLESGYEQYANAKPLNEFMGNSTHLYGNQIGVGSTDWMQGVSGPLKWLGGLIGGTLAGLFGLLGWLVRKGQQAVGVALLKRYITKIAAITDDGYKNMCTLWTSRKNRACFRTFQQASERDIIVSVDVCAKALGLLDNSLDYKPDQNPYIAAETLISDVHEDYLKDVKISSGFLGFNKLVDKPQEKIDNTKDIAAEYDIHIGNAYNKNQQSNHQQDDPASNESFNYSGYNSLNEYKTEEEHYGTTKNYAKYMDAYLVAARNAWETLCKRLIGEVRIGDEVEYLKNNEKLDLKDQQNPQRASKSPAKFRSYIDANPPGESLDAWLQGFVKVYWRMDNNKIEKIFRDFAGEDDVEIKKTWKKLKNAYAYWKKNQTSENMNEIWKQTDIILNELKDNIQNESVSYKNENPLNEVSSAGEGVNTWRIQDIDNNLIQQMSNWLQRKDRFEWKITADFKKKCTELATAVDKEIITRINRWTTPAGAPGKTGINNKGFNSPITKAGLEKLWTAYKEELNNRIEARVDNFVTGNPFMYAVQFIQFTVPSLMKDILNTVNPENRERGKWNYVFDYGTIYQHCLFGEIINEENPTSPFINIYPLTEEERTIIFQSEESSQNESFIMFKGQRFRLFEEDENGDVGHTMNDDDDDSAIDNPFDNDEDSDDTQNNNTSETTQDTQDQQPKGLLIDGYSIYVKVVKRSDVKNIVAEWNKKFDDSRNKWLFIPGFNGVRANDYYPIAAVNGPQTIFNYRIFNENSVDDLGKNLLYVYLGEDNTIEYNQWTSPEVSLDYLKKLYINDTSTNESTNESVKYKESNRLFEITEEIGDESNINDNHLDLADDEDTNQSSTNNSEGSNQEQSTDNQNNNSDNQNSETAEKTDIENWIDSYCAVKLPIFWYGNKAILPENEITEEWVTMAIPQDLRNKLIEALNKVKEKDEEDSELNVYWPVGNVSEIEEGSSEESSQNQNQEEQAPAHESFNYSGYDSLNEGLEDDMPTEGDSNPSGESKGETGLTVYRQIDQEWNKLKNNLKNSENKKEENNNSEQNKSIAGIQLNEKLADKNIVFKCKGLKEQIEKDFKVTFMISSNLQGTGSDIELKKELSDDTQWNEEENMPKVIGSVKWEISDLNNIGKLENDKTLIIPFSFLNQYINKINEKVQELIKWQHDLTEKKNNDTPYEKNEEEYAKMICDPKVKYESFKINMNFKAGDLSMDECLSGDKNKYKNSPIKAEDIIVSK